ncbi:MAG: 4a-hydroxytetrahydrobiopterin dehydratase [Phycisphaerales bacterium]
MEKLNQDQIDQALAALPNWSQVGEAIQRTFDFENFIVAMKFVDKVAVAAEQVQHHPDILIRYKKVTLTYATHDANGITAKDFDAAANADQIAAAVQPPRPRPAPKAKVGSGKSGGSRAGMKPPKV